MTTTETGHVTGTKDKDYDLIWFVETCLDNVLRLEIYIEDAESSGDSELAELFTKAQADSRKGAELGKQLLGERITGQQAQGQGQVDPQTQAIQEQAPEI
jgi:hypothetical protein